MKKINKNNSGYSVIMALLIIGFLLVLSIGIFNLVLNEMKDNRAMGDYIKVYAGAESAQELALLKIKHEGYGYYDNIDHNVNNRSILLASEPLDTTLFKGAKDVFMSYDIGSKTNYNTGTLSSLSYNIIPLFYRDDTGEHKVEDINLIISGISGNIAWNIIGKDKGISGTGNIVGSTTRGFMKTLDVNNSFVLVDDKIINDFLVDSDLNYLVLLNTGNISIDYALTANTAGEFFTKPKTTIISSAEVGNYKQNLSTELNNTDFLDMLKYSIFSN